MSNRKLFYIKMRATVNFCYEESPIEIQCLFDDEMNKIFKNMQIN